MWQLVLYLVMPPILFLFVAQLTILVGMRLDYPGERPDPFAPYEAMMPGQWVMASGLLPCEIDSIPGNFEMISCDVQHPADGHFVSVSSSIYNGSFVETWFNANNLLVGDIMRHWGRPDVVVNSNHQSFYVLWIEQGLVGFIDPIGQARQFNYLLPVERFTIGLESAISPVSDPQPPH